MLLEWGDENDGVTVWRCGRALLHTRARGRLGVDVVEAFLAQLDAMVSEGVRGVVVFHDFEALLGYDSAARQRLTEWRRSAPAGTTRALHLLVRSKLVAMGASTASLALRLVGVELQSYTDRGSFERALETARVSARTP